VSKSTDSKTGAGADGNQLFTKSIVLLDGRTRGRSVCLTAGHVVHPRSDVSRAAQVEPMRKSLYLQNPQRLIVLGVALIATLLLTPNGRADHRDPVPRFSQSQLAQQFPSLPAGGTWQLSANPAPATLLNNPLLLTDGTIVVIQQATSNWYKLTPDAFGNYATGTWSQIASLPSGYEPLYFASAVLPDGRVIVEGGECNTWMSTMVLACGK
jgi:hypothetical protein